VHEKRRRVTLHRFPRCPASPPPVNYPAVPSPGPGFVAEARREARVVIGKLRFPSGTKPVAHSPTRSAGSPPIAVCLDPETAGYYEYWVSDRSLQALIDWVKAHPPAGARGLSEGSSSSHGVITSEFLGFQFAPASTVTEGAQLFVTGRPLPGGRTAIRVDADVTWLVLRPAAEQVPDGVRTITMSFTQASQQGGATTNTVTVTEQSQIEEIEWLTDVLPVQQPSEVAPPCGPDTASVEVRFEGIGGNTLAEAEADNAGCVGVAFFFDGQSQVPLASGDYYNVLQTAFDSTSG
jgi:hypothetical protein